MFSLEPHSHTVSVVLSDTSKHLEDSVDAVVHPATSAPAEEAEPEATSAPAAAAAAP